MLMDQSSQDDTLVDVGPPEATPAGAVSRQSSRDEQRKRSAGGSSMGEEGRAISDARILAHTASGDTLLVVVDGDELPVGPHAAALYQPVRLYHADRDVLTEPLWLGSALKFLGGYLEEPRLDEPDEERVLARVAELVPAG